MDNPSLIGKTLRGYELIDLIGTGGFGAVYRAEQRVIGREVAVKVILPQHANSPQFVRRFEAEAQFVARLEHPHIVPLFDYWRDPQGAYLVMRYIRGGSLSHRLKQVTLSNSEIGRLLDEITAALSVAHRNNVAHLDLKPDNIMFDPDGNAYLTDFGIAKSTEGGVEDTDENRSGTVAYTSPEQLQGEPPPTAQSDIYSLGLILYETLTGEHAFQIDQPITQLIMKQLSATVPSVLAKRPDLPNAIDSVIQRATAKTPADRYQDVREVALEYHQLVLQQASIASTVEFMSVGTVTNPYKGLRAFEEADAQHFFGREDLTTQLVGYLMTSSFLAVVGPSGSGKSSLVKAGLIPALRRGALTGSENWYVAEFVPGTDPLGNLASALNSIATRPAEDLRATLQQGKDGLQQAVNTLFEEEHSSVLLVIDQFEEVFTQLSQESERAHFLALLRTAVRAGEGRLRLVITLRADFYDRPLHYEGFGALIQENTQVVLPLSVAELERAVLGPLERVGLSAEADLVAAIIADVREEPGALPLLQYALTEVFERRQGNPLTLQDYTATGGVSGALAKRAEEVHQELPARQKKVSRQVFLRLVTLGEGSEDTRRRARYSELMDLGTQATIQAVLDSFGKYRLLTFDTDPETREPLVEVAHEALIREWRRLTDWLNESRDDIRQQRLLDYAAREWMKNNQEPSFLLRGSRLAQVEEWRAVTDLQLTAQENNFLTASIAERERLQQMEQERRNREKALEARAQRRLQLIALVSFIAMIIGVGLSILVFRQGRETAQALATSEFNKDLAETQVAIAATAERVAAREADAAADQAARAQSLALSTAGQLALIDGNLDSAMAFAAQANEADDTPLQSRLILAQLAYTVGTQRRLEVGATVNTVGLDATGDVVVSGSRDGVLATWDVTTGDMIRIYEGHEDRISAAAMRNGSLISGSWDDTAILWDVASGEPLHRLTGHEDNVLAVALSADGTQALTAGNDALIRVWDVGSGALVQTLSGHTAPVFSAVFSPDGTQVLSGGADDTVRLWDATSGDLLNTFEGHTGRVNSVAIAARGGVGASASNDGTIRLYNLTTNTTINVFEDHNERVNSVTFSRDGRYVISGDRAGRLLVWDTTAREIIYTLDEHSDSILTVDATPDGQRVASGSADGTIRVWALGASGALQADILPGQAASALAFAPSGETWLAATEDGLQTYPAAPPDTDPLARFPGSGGLTTLAVSENGALAAGATQGRDIIIWETRNQQRLLTFENAHTGAVNALAFVPGERFLLSGAADATVALWDTVTGERTQHFTTGHEDAVRAVAASPSGDRALSGSNDGSIVLWDLNTGREFSRVIGVREAVADLAFAPDGASFYGALGDGSIRQWDVTNMVQPRQVFDGHREAITVMGFSPGFEMMLSADENGTLILWDVANSAQVHRFRTTPLAEISFAPDGQTALALSTSGEVSRWRTLSLGTLRGWVLQNRYIPSLSCEQRELFGLPPCETP